MFGFFKDKLKGMVSKFSKEVEEEVKDGEFDSEGYYEEELKNEKPKPEQTEGKEKTPKEEVEEEVLNEASKETPEEKAEEKVEDEPKVTAEQPIVEKSPQKEQLLVSKQDVETAATPHAEKEIEQTEAVEEKTEGPAKEKVEEQTDEKSDSQKPSPDEIKEKLKQEFRDQIYKKYNIKPKEEPKQVVQEETQNVEEVEQSEADQTLEETKEELEEIAGTSSQEYIQDSQVEEAEETEEIDEVAKQEVAKEEATQEVEKEEITQEVEKEEAKEEAEETEEVEKETDKKVEETADSEAESEEVEKSKEAEDSIKHKVETSPKEDVIVKEVDEEVKTLEVPEQQVKQERSEAEESELDNTIHDLDEGVFDEVDEGEHIEYKEEEKGFFSKMKDKFFKPKETIVEKQSVREAEKLEQKQEKKELEEAKLREKEVEKELSGEKESPEEKTGFFGKIKQAFTTKTLSEDKFEDLFFNLEIALLENNVALAVIDKIKGDLKVKLVDQKLNRFQIEQIIASTLKDSITELFDIPKINILDEIEKKKQTQPGEPYIISFVGINGVGKTTNLAKVANYLKKKGKSVVMAAGDTFRVAAIEQIEEHANNLGIKLIKHEYGSDAAAVCFDAVKHAKSKDIEVVLIDTAGRSNANVNLMNELEKVIKVSKSDLKIFVGDSLTGNDAVEQAEKFNESVGIDGVILTKSDADEKGGTAISIGWVLKKPILFLGTGQTYDDLTEFDPKIILNNLGLN